jgi:ribonuclease BN (tRNA processing enzyme)
MQLQFVGCGDAFGSGGRFNTCFHLRGETVNALIDCGASSLVALKQRGIDRNAVDTIVVTHFHGDHFGGIPFFILDAQLVSKRERPLIIVGPPGLVTRYERAMDTAFPSFPHRPERFPLTLTELAIGEATQCGVLRLTAYPVVHAEAAGPCVGYRIEAEGKVFAYSGDTEWTESIVGIGRNADLFVCEAYSFERKVKSHTDLKTLERNIQRIGAKRLVLTHLGEDMLAHRHQTQHQIAEDGLVVEF